MHRFTLRQLEYFIACYEHRSIAAAAEILHISQPTISVALTKLEDQLGVQLFVRQHSQGITPTTNAENLVQSARNLMAGASDLQWRANIRNSKKSGELKLGSFISLAPRFIPGLLVSIQKIYPEFKLIITENTQENLIEALYSGQLEMALMYDFNLPDNLSKTYLAKAAPYVALPADHPLTQKDIIDLVDLKNEPLILLDVAPSRDFFLGILKSVNIDPNIVFSSPSLELVRGMVGAGLGYSLLVTRPKGDLTYNGEKIEVRPIADNILYSQIILAKLSSLRSTSLMATLEDCSVEYFNQLNNINNYS